MKTFLDESLDALQEHTEKLLHDRLHVGEPHSKTTAVRGLWGKNGKAGVIVLSYSSPAQRNIILAVVKHLKGLSIQVSPNYTQTQAHAKFRRRQQRCEARDRGYKAS